MPSISENITECKRGQSDFCEAMDEISQIFTEMRETADQATWWTGSTKEQFTKVMNQRFEEFEQLKNLANQEMEFYDCWETNVNELHNIFEEFIEKIRRM